jgi:hypothetical protein
MNYGGPGGPALRLENPLKLQRIAVVRPARPSPSERTQSQSERDNSTDRSGPPSRVSPAAIASRKPIGSIGIDGEVIRPVLTEGRMKRSIAGKEKPGSKDWKKGAEEGRKASLKITTGKKGRSAEINSRRGSLKRRDKSSEKAAKEEAALERKTVYLPE